MSLIQPVADTEQEKIVMGIALNGFGALVRLYRQFGAFGATLQVGRQGLFLPTDQLSAADAMMSAAGVGKSLTEIVNLTAFADEMLFPALGAAPVEAIDASSYEGATYVHDFNDPIDESMYQRFDTIIDGGSLEHIFNVPQSLANMMSLLRVGGRILHIVPANDWLGHGLYQFGPELFFRVYQPENGFALHSVDLSNVNALEPWLRFIDKGAEGARNEIYGSHGPAELLVVASKTEHRTPFAKWPQQGDYQVRWAAAALS